MQNLTLYTFPKLPSPSSLTSSQTLLGSTPFVMYENSFFFLTFMKGNSCLRKDMTVPKIQITRLYSSAGYRVRQYVLVNFLKYYLTCFLEAIDKYNVHVRSKHGFLQQNNCQISHKRFLCHSLGPSTMKFHPLTSLFSAPAFTFCANRKLTINFCF